jgi:predicted nicotinamide N-methyase
MSGEAVRDADEAIVIGRFTFVVRRPVEPEGLIDEDRFATDEFLPYWAELWPSGLALARTVAELDLRGSRVLELGCGLGLPSLAAAAVGANVRATDWSAESIDLVRRNAAANELRIDAAVLDWFAPGTVPPPVFDLVLAADVLYEERNAGPLLALLGSTVAQGGEAVIADPGRRHAPAFFSGAEAGGWAVEHVPVPSLPAGGIAWLRRPVD